MAQPFSIQDLIDSINGTYRRPQSYPPDYPVSRLGDQAPAYRQDYPVSRLGDQAPPYGQDYPVSRISDAAPMMPPRTPTPTPAADYPPSPLDPPPPAYDPGGGEVSPPAYDPGGGEVMGAPLGQGGIGSDARFPTGPYANPPAPPVRPGALGKTLAGAVRKPAPTRTAAPAAQRRPAPAPATAQSLFGTVQLNPQGGSRAPIYTALNLGGGPAPTIQPQVSYRGPRG